MPIYIVRKGYNAIGVGRGAMSKMWTGVDGWMDTPQTVMTTRAPAVLIKVSFTIKCIKRAIM